MHMKCRNFISGLHILASNRIPESILNADVLSNILYGVSQYLFKENMYRLLYGSIVNPYYDMRIGKSSIINNILYMTISLPLKHMKVPSCQFTIFILTTCQQICQTIRNQDQLTQKLKSAVHISYWVMINLPYSMTIWIKILYSMMTCMSRSIWSCYSDVQIKIVMSTSLNMPWPRSFPQHVRFPVIRILLYM